MPLEVRGWIYYVSARRNDLQTRLGRYVLVLDAALLGRVYVADRVPEVDQDSWI